MVAKYKIKCYRCKKAYVPVASSRQVYVLCYDCQKETLKREITDPQMKTFFDVPEDFYKMSPLLRNIKVNYIKCNQLSKKQMDCFAQTVSDLKESNYDNKFRL